MSSNDDSSARCYEIANILDELFFSGKELSKKISRNDIFQLYFSCGKEEDAESGDRFSKPMVWIGIYIAIASFFCILAMGADLLHGLRNKSYWFPCKYFSLNATSITVITVAMKLTVDLSSVMPTRMDQATKLGSLAFMCTMMANLMPSLASMDNKTLQTNILGLAILVITMIVNTFIQINTSVINNHPLDGGYYYFYFDFVMVAYIYMAMILLLQLIIISSSLAIPISKEILESKYQATNKISLSDQRLQRIQLPVVEKLRQHVRRYWIMAETGDPQFVMASNPLSTASGVICATVLVINLFMMFKIRFELYDIKLLNFIGTLHGSPYKLSTLAIFITQSIGVVVGTVAPVSRCFLVFSVNLGIKRNWSVFLKVEKYWTQRLLEWKQISHAHFLSNSRRSRSVIFNSKSMILRLCIGFQKTIVVSCKLIWLIAILVPKNVINCLHHWKLLKTRWFTPSISSRTGDIVEDLRSYVLQIDDDMELAEKTLKGVSNSMDSFILKAVKEQNNHLLQLLENSTGFKGVEIFDSDCVQPLLSIKLVNSWSLPVVTLTCIAVAFPNIPKETVDNLFKSVSEGLSYTYLVEESLNCGSEYVNLRKTSMSLWQEVEHKCKWLDTPLAKKFFKGKTTAEIIRCFSDKAKAIVIEINESTMGESGENPPQMLIAANSMYRMTQTILLKFQSNIELITIKQLFGHLNDMIGDIFCACFTNIPRVIRMRCHESAIEKREASVKVAAKLLGKTTKILERLEARELPSMDDDKMAYIDEWRLYLKRSIP